MAQKLSFIGTECSLYCNVNETENTASVKVKYNNNFLLKRDSVTRFFTSLFSSSKDSTCAPHEQFGNFFCFREDIRLEILHISQRKRKSSQTVFLVHKGDMYFLVKKG